MESVAGVSLQAAPCIYGDIPVRHCKIYGIVQGGLTVHAAHLPVRCAIYNMRAVSDREGSLHIYVSRYVYMQRAFPIRYRAHIIYGAPYRKVCGVYSQPSLHDTVYFTVSYRDITVYTWRSLQRHTGHRFHSESTLQDIEIGQICPDLDLQVGS